MPPSPVSAVVVGGLHARRGPARSLVLRNLSSFVAHSCFIGASARAVPAAARRLPTHRADDSAAGFQRTPLITQERLDARRRWPAHGLKPFALEAGPVFALAWLIAFPAKQMAGFRFRSIH
ncbi:hypothetical protein KCP78_09470 [Salmonella enterica subsp. enterica]|nr:hypothetical protein KCP78_09470 [Salmonella enterica subsp. enterica]